MAKKSSGRPQQFTPEQIQEIVKDFKAYIQKEDDPTIVGFTSSYPPIYSETLGRETYINKDYINDHQEFSELKKLAIEKQEAYIVKGVLQNKLNATMGVFRLKQPCHGYTDRQEITGADGGPMLVKIGMKQQEDNALEDKTNDSEVLEVKDNND